MPHAIHISQARKILESGKPCSISVFKADGSIMHLENCVSLRYSLYGGVRNVRLLASSQIRKIRDALIFMVNGCEVYL